MSEKAARAAETRFIARETIDWYCAPGRFICLKTRETLRLVNLSATQNNARATRIGRALRPLSDYSVQ